MRKTTYFISAFITISLGIATAIPDSRADEAKTLAGSYEGSNVTGGKGDDVIYADGPPFTKSTFPGLILWLDASDSTSMAMKPATQPPLGETKGELKPYISQWMDKSGTGNHATIMCSETNFRFEQVPIGKQNPRANVSLEQNGNCLQVPNLDSNQFTVYFVHAGGKPFSLFSTNDSGWQVALDQPPGQNGFFMSKLGGTVTKSKLKTSYGEPQEIFGVTYDGKAATFYSTKQGEEKVTYKGDGFNSTGGNYTFGPPGMSAAEVLVFNTALTPQNRAILHEYLAHKYHISLPGKKIGVNMLTGGLGADKFTWTENSNFDAPGTDRLVYDSTGRVLDIVNSYGPQTFIWDGMKLTNVTIDHITDFSGAASGQYDKIDISAFELAGNVQVTGLGSLTGIPNQLAWFQSTLNTIVQFDRTGDRKPDWEIVLESFNAIDLKPEDFILPPAK
jgi:hypothetical protein